MMINGSTRLFGILGSGVGNSFSPAIYNSAFQYHNLNHSYIPIQAAPGSLETVLRALPAMNYAGFNVTIPYKEAVISFMHKVEGDAGLIEAVNTVSIQDGKMIGYNTDAQGFGQSLAPYAHQVRNKTILIIGAGGAAKAVSYYLLKSGLPESLLIWNRSRMRADGLLHWIAGLGYDTPVKHVESIHEIGQPAGIINCTPVGTPLPEQAILGSKLVFDLTYNPGTPPSVVLAQRARITAVNGLPMLLHQAAEAFKIWTGRDFPYEHVESELREQKLV